MISTLLLSSALAVGQAPVLLPDPDPNVPLPQQVVFTPAQPPRDPEPAAPTTVPAQATLPSAGGDGVFPGIRSGEAAAGPEKAEQAPGNQYLAEQLLAGTSFGRTLADRGIRVFGWTDMNYSWSSNRETNFPVGFNDRADHYQLNQNWLEVSKPIDPCRDEVQAGFRSAWILPGTDYRYTLPRGLWNDQLARGNEYGIDWVYHYGELFLPGVGGRGTTVRAGRFATPVGYEAIDAVATPFLSRSYLFLNNPLTHTGALATTQLTDDWSVSNGLATGSDVWIDPAAQLTYLGGLRYAPQAGRGSVAFNAVVGNHKFFRGENFAHYNVYNVVATRRLTDRLTSVWDATYSHMRDVPGVGSTDWYGAASYYLFQLTDKVAINWRGEWFRDADGVRTGTRGTYYETTVGATWVPVDALIIRPWFRYDWSQNGAFEGKDNLYTGGIEAILRW